MSLHGCLLQKTFRENRKGYTVYYDSLKKRLPSLKDVFLKWFVHKRSAKVCYMLEWNLPHLNLSLGRVTKRYATLERLLPSQNFTHGWFLPLTKFTLRKDHQRYVALKRLLSYLNLFPGFELSWYSERWFS